MGLTTSNSPYLIVGLGNPGRAYAHTRHNVGFDSVLLLAQELRVRLDRKQRQALVGEGDWEGRRLILALPQTFMNLSGLAVAGLVGKHRVPLTNLLVVYDEMDLPVGTIRLRERGSAAGHHGMESIIAALHSQEFPRLRIGVGKAVASDAGADHVLSRFNARERDLVDDAIARAVKAIKLAVREGVAAAMNEFNRRPSEEAP